MSGGRERHDFADTWLAQFYSHEMTKRFPTYALLAIVPQILFTLACASRAVDPGSLPQPPPNLEPAPVLVGESRSAEPAKRPTGLKEKGARVPALETRDVRKPLFLISDIDDTIRRTHVLDRSEMVRNGVRSDLVFAGLSNLYNAWSCAPLAEGQAFRSCLAHHSLSAPDSRWVGYVSAAPGDIQIFATYFLVRSGFPAGTFKGRESMGDDKFVFKVDAIKKLISDFPGADVVLIGDNGEKDVSVFKEVVRWASVEKSQTKIFTFVHQVYADRVGEEPSRDQNVYATAADLGLSFHALGWIGDKELQLVFDAVEKALATDVESVFPEWMDCRSLVDKRPLASLPLPQSEPLRARAANLIAKSIKICKASPKDD